MDGRDGGSVEAGVNAAGSCDGAISRERVGGGADTVRSHTPGPQDSRRSDLIIMWLTVPLTPPSQFEAVNGELEYALV